MVSTCLQTKWFQLMFNPAGAYTTSMAARTVQVSTNASFNSTPADAALDSSADQQGMCFGMLRSTSTASLGDNLAMATLQPCLSLIRNRKLCLVLHGNSMLACRDVASCVQAVQLSIR